jgi:hypothetical protein
MPMICGRIPTQRAITLQFAAAFTALFSETEQRA